MDLLPAAEGRRFGWKPPSPELHERLKRQSQFRVDLPFSMPAGLAMPGSVDLRPNCPPVYDQSPFSACTANAVAGMIHYFRIRDGLPAMPPSRLFIYWFERLSAGTQGQDAGGTIAEAVSAAFGQGCCAEVTWPYVTTNLFAAPSGAAVAEGSNHSVSQPVSLGGLQQIKVALARGQPVAFGLWLYNSFFDADYNHGLVPMPDTNGPNEKHAGLFVGYDDGTRRLIMRNSWGLSTPTGRPCGDRGYYYLPYDYVGGTLSTDFWTIGSVFDHQ